MPKILWDLCRDAMHRVSAIAGVSFSANAPEAQCALNKIRRGVKRKESGG